MRVGSSLDASLAEELQSLVGQIARWRPDMHSDEIRAQVVGRAAAIKTDPRSLAEDYLVRARNGIPMPWDVG